MSEQTVVLYDDAWLPLPAGPALSTTVEVDDITRAAVEPFDLAWSGETRFEPTSLPSQLPADFGIGVIVGASGSGKSTLLREFGPIRTPSWSDGAIASHFTDALEAADRFYAVGLNAVPTWTKPYDVLSTGERFRADLARLLGDDAVIDEYTSVVDRNVAVSTSNALRRYVTDKGLRRLVIATCHRDVLPWLEPDWVIDLDIRCWALRPRECLQRPQFVVEVYEATRAAWDVFAPYHYLSTDLHPFARCFVAVMNGHLVAFAAVLPFPNGHLRNAWRGHRTVVLPDFQGLGLGMRLSDWVGERMLTEGKRYFSRTAHPRMVAYRDASTLWRNGSRSPVRTDVRFGFKGDDDLSGATRVAVSHEFIGAGASSSRTTVVPVTQSPMSLWEDVTERLRIDR